MSPWFAVGHLLRQGTGGPMSEASSVHLLQTWLKRHAVASLLRAEQTKLSSNTETAQSEIGLNDRYLLQDETASATRRQLLQYPGVALLLLICRFASAAAGCRGLRQAKLLSARIGFVAGCRDQMK